MTTSMPAARDAATVAFHAGPLGGSPLARAMADGSAPAAWGGRAPRSVDGWRARAAALRDADARCRVPLDAFGGAALPEALRRRLTAHANGEGFVVTTGQQPGLFGGPAYTVTKALAARALAAALESVLDAPVTPVFWAATDDADWREASRVGVVGPDGLLEPALAGPPTDGRPMADVPLGDLTAARRAFVRACGSAADQPLLDAVLAAYVPGATIGDAYVAVLRTLLEPLGMPVLDASHPAVREAAHPVAVRALERAREIDAALRARADAITAAGHAPQVESVDGLSLVFRTAGGVKERVPVATAARVAAHAEPGSLSGNVLLRPVIERALLPTLSYVAGPGELAYFAQVGAVADGGGFAPPVAAPRVPMRWETPALREHRAAVGLSDAELADAHGAEATLATRALDPDVASALGATRSAFTDALDRLRARIAAEAGDGAPLVAPAVIDGVARDVGHRLDRLERRVLAGEKRRGAAWRRTLALARAEVAPGGRSPERVLSLLPVLIRYGRGVLDGAAAVAEAHAAALVHGSAASAR